MVSHFKAMIVVLGWHLIGLFIGFLTLFLFRLVDDEGDLALQILIVSCLASLLTTIIFLSLKRFYGKITHDSLVKDSRKIIIYLLTSSVLFFNLNVLVHTVLNTDRSRSFFVLNWIDCAPEFATRSTIQNEVEKKYGEESVRAFDKRVEEHSRRGLVVKSKLEIRLTWAGVAVLRISEILTSMFDLKGPLENTLWEPIKNRC